MFNFSEEVMIILKNAEKEASSLYSNFLGSEHVLLSILSKPNEISNLLNKYNIKYSNIKKYILKTNNNKKEEVEYIFYSPSLKRILDSSISNSKELGFQEVTLKMLFLSMLEERESKCTSILEEFNLDLKTVYKEIKNATMDSSSLLKELGTEFTSAICLDSFDKVIGRDEEIERIIEILARKKKNNPLLIGEAGVGKTAIIEELSRKISTSNVPTFLKDYKIIGMNVSSLVAGTKYRGEFEEKLDKMIRDLESNKKIILFIDEIHTIVGAGGAEGAIDASNILKPALARGKLKLIGATTIDEYKKFIMPDKALSRRFDIVMIEEPEYEKTKDILMKIKKDYEKYHGVIVPKEIVDSIVYYADKYIKDKHEPDKSIDILDEVCARTMVLSNKMNEKENKLTEVTKSKNQCLKNKDFKKAIELKKIENDLLKNSIKKTRKKVTKDILKSVLESKTNTRIFELENKKINSYLYQELIKKININPKEIKEITNLYEVHVNKSRTQYQPTSILLEGTSGVGKTYIAKLLSEITKCNFININLKEFKSDMNISRFLGASSGYVGYLDNNTVFESLKFYPNSIILFDNYDEGHPSIINLIKSILENGKITNSRGIEINFSNSFIILTTNVENGLNKIGFSNTEKKVNNLSDNNGIETLVNKIVKITKRSNKKNLVTKEQDQSEFLVI